MCSAAILCKEYFATQRMHWTQPFFFVQVVYQYYGLIFGFQSESAQ